MIKEIRVEEIAKKDEFLKTKLLTRAEVKNAIDLVIKQIDANIEYFKDKFPSSATKNNEYGIIENIEWTDGFWTGLLWLAYEYTGDEKYRELADKNVASFKNRVEKDIELDHHDLGFLYSLATVSGYKLTGSEDAREASIKAANKLTSRYQEKGEFIQAWGELGRKDHYRFIIDCLLNILLLYWASDETGDAKYRNIANKHFVTSCNNVIRDDASAFHTFYMDNETGKPLRGVTRQGYSDDSAWARGQAWGVYGIPLNYRYTRNESCFNLYEGMTNYFLNRLPKDNVCYWDLIFNDGDDHSKDSSAAAIAVCGMHEMNKYLPEVDENKEVYKYAMHNILRSLIENYMNPEIEPGKPVLLHGVYSWHSGKGVDEGNIWGDYFFLEALIRFYKDWNLYW
ncbi:glycoside hydrolase family 88 protein [Clostridium perfringens]|uniref:Putative glucuronyl hydrolase n=1 Tax=Clostridium perfringens (strain SM101 / Type A) TaxID=289380 RepID=Q0SVX5_CLOPS|nr:glycoside hydrolase family 88 protein [Clostridium perfringens]ABG87664.1 putative glucuronyl hydrolase [Clostridium perfringens SM101]EJT5926048.1 glycoside hydrolase family 88 protein [Clostridium perfringens]MBP2860432.1 glycoside hydrolase family 88 protein [Clostridium perfringens]MDH5061921.1 Unsaturated chondroitin disaccharide hydrolase [Clostridium perfringens NCTC 8239]UBK56054.1 glycoside hydrolase family 88 protein [Clostridium perfringens]